MQRILIIEDDKSLAGNILEQLNLKGYNSKILKNFNCVKEEFYNFSPHLILLDINLGNYNGFEICISLRKITKIPILFITGRDSERSEIEALNIGGDDYIKKPFSIDVLIAKIRRQLEIQSMENRKIISYGKLELEVDKRILKNIETSEILELPTIEFQLLFYLMANSERIVDRGELMDYLWENRNYVDPNALNVNLSRLRKSLSEVSAEHIIESVRGEGLKLC